MISKISSLFITSLIFLDQFRPSLKHAQPQKVNISKFLQ